MSKSPASAEPTVMPRLPAASIDFNALHEADAKGVTGEALIAAAVVPAAPAEAVVEAPAEAPAAKPITSDKA